MHSSRAEVQMHSHPCKLGYLYCGQVCQHRLRTVQEQVQALNGSFMVCQLHAVRIHQMLMISTIRASKAVCCSRQYLQPRIWASGLVHALAYSSQSGALQVFHRKLLMPRILIAAGALVLLSVQSFKQDHQRLVLGCIHAYRQASLV